MAQAQYARWENGGRNPKDETVEKLSDIFGVSFDYLKGRNDGLEEIIEMLKENNITQKQKQDVLKILSDYFGSNSNSESL